MFTHRLATSLQKNGQFFAASVSKQAASEVNLEESIPEDADALPIALPIDVSALVSLYISSDQDLTIETNDSTTPDDTIAVKAGVPLWYDAANAAIFPNPLSADVTTIYVTGVEAATLRIFALVDPTP